MDRKRAALAATALIALGATFGIYAAKGVASKPTSGDNLPGLEPEREHEAPPGDDVHIYDQVNHGFWLHVDSNAEVATPAAKDAWKRLKAYLKSTLG